MRNSNKSKVEVKNASGVESTMLTRSRSMESFVNQREWAQLLLEYGNYDRFREAFNQYIIDPSQLIDDYNEEGYVWIQDVQHIFLGNFLNQFANVRCILLPFPQRDYLHLLKIDKWVLN